MTDTKADTSAEARRTTAASSRLSRLAEKGEEAIKRLSDELDKNARAHEAKDRLTKLQRTTMHQLNIALADEVGELRKEITRLEKRLVKLEKETAAGSEARR